MAWSLVALLTAGCSSWQGTRLAPTAPAAPGDTLLAWNPTPAPGLPERLRLHLRDGTVVTLEHPRVNGDSLRGTNIPPPQEPRTFSGRAEPSLGRVPRAVALSDIRKVESKRFDGVKSLVALGAVGGLCYLGLLIAYGISLHGASA